MNILFAIYVWGLLFAPFVLLVANLFKKWITRERFRREPLTYAFIFGFTWICWPLFGGLYASKWFFYIMAYCFPSGTPKTKKPSP